MSYKTLLWSNATTKMSLALLLIAGLVTTSACGDPEDPSADCNLACQPIDDVCDGDTLVKTENTRATGRCACEKTETRTKCADSGKVCRSGACVDPSDPCDGVTCDMPPADKCDGTNAVTYAAAGTCEQGACNYTETKTDCAADNKTCMDGKCVDGDQCANVTCDTPPAAMCDGSKAVTYAAAGTCKPEDGTCEYTATETDCAADNKICKDGACAEGTDMCANVTCDMPPADKCDGTNAVTYAAAGTCNQADGTCSYTENTEDCAASNKTCMMGKCMDGNVTPVAPSAGDIVITEIMYDSSSVSDTVGEWVEIYNVSSKTLDLRGMFIGDNNKVDAYQIPANEANGTLPPDTYLVFGRSADKTKNGNVDVDIVYTDPGFNNGGDSVILSDANQAEIARVNYGGAGWDDPTGATLQISGAIDLKNNYSAGPMGWCIAPNAWDGADRGSPGVKNPDCPSTVAAEFTIKQLRDSSDPMHPAPGTRVLVKGAVVSATSTNHAWIQDVAGGEFSGIYLDVDATTTPMGVTVGTTLVDVEGTYDEMNGLSVIKVISVSNVGSAAQPIQPQVIESRVLANPTEAEKWEGVLVRVNEAGVTNANPDGPNNDYGEFTIDNAVRVDDLLFAQATAESTCDLYTFIAGPLNYSFGNYKIEPRDANDFGTKVAVPLTAGNAAAVTITRAAGGFSPQNLCVAPNTIVTWTNNDSIAHTATSRDASLSAPNNISAQPVFDLSLAANASVAETFATSGTFHYRCRPHQGMNGVVIVTE